MSHFLDTNICVYSLAGKHAKMAARLKDLSPNQIKISAIVRAELMYGAAKSQNRRLSEDVVHAFLLPYEIVPFDESAADRHAAIRAALEKKGTPIGANDLILAATVLARDGVLVTHNTKEFRRVRGLRLEDWTK